MTFPIGLAESRGDNYAIADIASAVAECLEDAALHGPPSEAQAARGATDWATLSPPLHHALQAAIHKPTNGQGSERANARPEDRVKNAFKQEFAAKAGDKQQVDAFMRQVYGKYDKNLAEQYRQQALKGDFSFLPDVKFVDAATLAGGKGAYNEKEGVVYISKDVAASNPDQAAQVFVEEAGAHLDAKLNTVDTKGDEGEMFRRVLSGEHLSEREIDAIRNDDDHGTITVDGKKVEVEFWFGEDIVDAVGSAAEDVGKAVGSAAEDVGKAVAGGAKAVGGAIGDAADWVYTGAKMVGGGVIDGIKTIGEGALGGLKDFCRGVFIDMMVGFATNLFDGDLSEAFHCVVRGIDRAVIQSTQRFFVGVIDGVQSAANGITRALGPVGEPLRWVTDRFFDIVQTGVETSFAIGRDAFRILPDAVIGFVGDVERSVKLAIKGDWGAAAKQFGLAFVNTPGRVFGPMVDMVATALRGGASVVLTAVDAEPPARKLNEDEIRYLKTIYGDSIDYGLIRVKPGGPLNDTARTVGNTIYMEDDHFNPDGTLTAEGLKTLGHEAGHVWQNQNGGGDYIHNALGSQAAAKVFSSDRNAAYDWRAALANGESFETMNDEQRAKLTEDIGVALMGKPYDQMNASEQANVVTDVRRALAGGAPFDSLTAAELKQLQTGIGKALAGGRSFGAMNEAQRTQVMDNIRNTLLGIPSFSSKRPEQQAAILAEIRSRLADGTIDARDGIRAPTNLKPGGEGAYTPEEIAFMKETWEKLRSGYGAG
jgi:hypothetical protein